MPEMKQTHGGDDDDIDDLPQEAPPPKPKLDKFASKPDINIRDVFWKMMENYLENGAIPAEELKKFNDERFPLVRASISVLGNPHGYTYELTREQIAFFTIKMTLDAEWEDAFEEYLEEIKNSKGSAPEIVRDALKEACLQKENQKRIIEYLRIMLRNREGAEIALYFIAQIQNAEISAELKKELLVLSRGDIGTNQMNAMAGMSVIKNDDEVKKTLISILSHWDEEARYNAADILNGMKDDEVREAAKKRKDIEPNQEIKELLEKLAT